MNPKKRKPLKKRIKAVSPLEVPSLPWGTIPAIILTVDSKLPPRIVHKLKTGFREIMSRPPKLP